MALRQGFYLATGVGALTCLGAFAFEWKSIKGKKTTPKADEEKQETTEAKKA